MKTEKYQTLIPFFEKLRGEHVLVRPYQESDAPSVFEAIAESQEHVQTNLLDLHFLTLGLFVNHYRSLGHRNIHLQTDV